MEIFLLAYADDLVILADTPLECFGKLKALSEYCKLNKLKVNIQKTKIMIFSNKKNTDSIKAFKFEDRSIKVVKEYNYLGVVLSSSITFPVTLNKLESSTNLAISSCIKIINKLKADTSETYNKLYGSFIANTIFYAIYIWGLNFLDNIE